MLPPPVVGQGQHGEDAAPELVAPYQSFARELLGLHAARLRLGCCPALLRSWSCPLGAARLIEERSGLLVSNGMRPQRENIDINGHTAVRIYLGPFPDLATAERESGKAMLVTGEPAFVVELP